MNAQPLPPLLNSHGFEIARCPACDRPFMHEVDSAGLHSVWCAIGRCSVPAGGEGDSGPDLAVVCARLCASIERQMEDALA